MSLRKGRIIRMSPLNGMLMIFSLIVFAFFGLPIAAVLILNAFFPSEYEPASKQSANKTTLKVTNEPLGVPINVMKIRNKGNIIWVDAVDTIDIKRVSEPHIKPAPHVWRGDE